MTLALNLLMPVMLAGISLYAMCKRVDVYDGVIHGAAEGLSVIYRIAPPLIALMTAIAMLRASGALELAAQALSPVLSALGIPAETVGADIIQTYGPDSEVGRVAAVMLGSTETTFYTVAVYFGAAGIKKTRYAIPAALCADFVGFCAAALAVRLFF